MPVFCVDCRLLTAFTLLVEPVQTPVAVDYA